MNPARDHFVRTLALFAIALLLAIVCVQLGRAQEMTAVRGEIKPVRGESNQRRESLQGRPSTIPMQRVLNAIAHVESRGNPRAVSRRGARGVYQLRDDVAAWCGVDAHDTPAARRCAARLLRLNLRRFGRLESALAAYVAGGGAVRRWQAAGEPWPPAVERYVDRVLERAGVL